MPQFWFYYFELLWAKYDDASAAIFSGQQGSSLNEEWGVDEQLITKLKEQYKKERKSKKKLQSK